MRCTRDSCGSLQQIHVGLCNSTRCIIASLLLSSLPSFNHLHLTHHSQNTVYERVRVGGGDTVLTCACEQASNNLTDTQPDTQNASTAMLYLALDRFANMVSSPASLISSRVSHSPIFACGIHTHTHTHTLSLSLSLSHSLTHACLASINSSSRCGEWSCPTPRTQLSTAGCVVECGQLALPLPQHRTRAHTHTRTTDSGRAKRPGLFHHSHSRWFCLPTNLSFAAISTPHPLPIPFLSVAMCYYPAFATQLPMMQRALRCFRS